MSLLQLNETSLKPHQTPLIGKRTGSNEVNMEPYLYNSLIVKLMEDFFFNPQNWKQLHVALQI